MTKKEATQALADHRKLARLVYGQASVWKMKKIGVQWVIYAPIRKGRKT